MPLFQDFEEEVTTVEPSKDVVGSAIDVDTVVSVEEATLEVAQIEKDLEEAERDIQQGKFVQSQIQRQTSAFEKLANEDADAITAATVEMANESMKQTAALLSTDPNNVDMDQFFGNMPSNESIEKDPLSSLEISNESMKEFAQKVVEKIKEIFENIKKMIKKLTAKAATVIDGTSKKAESLKDKLKDLEGDPEKFEDKDVEKLAKDVGVIAVVSGEVTPKTLETYIKFSTDTAILDSIGNAVGNVYSAVEKVVKADKPSDDDTKAVGEAQHDVVSVITGNAFARLVAENLGKLSKEGKDLEGTNVLPVRIEGTKVTLAVIKDGSDVITDPKKSSIDASLSTTTVSLDKKEMGNIKLTPLSAEYMKTALDVIIDTSKSAKDMGKLADDLNKKLDEKVEKIGKVMEDAESDEAKKAFKSFTDSANTVMSKVITARLFGAISANKNAYSFVRASYGQYNKKKDDK